MKSVIIVGGGASGILAAISSAKQGNKVSIYEKNDKLGRKLFITGKGRCNLTNSSSMEQIREQVVSNNKFLYTAFKKFTNLDLMNLVEKASCQLKIERGNRVFPVSDKSSDILKAFSHILEELKVDIFLNSEVIDLIYEEKEDEKIMKGILLKNNKKIYADAIILTTGGYSYKATGSTGDGYKFAKKLGHNIIKLYPALVPLVVKERDTTFLQGLSLKNVELSAKNKNNKVLYKNFGELLFTHFGLSGPLIISASSYITDKLENEEIKVFIDLKPALSEEKLDKRILRDFEEFKNKSLKNALVNLLPQKLIDVIIERANLDKDKKVSIISKKERKALIKNIKELSFTIIETRGFKEAIITKGGIDTKEINPKTMESKLVKNLFFAGEIIDVDALTGGYNLQVAFSSAYLAGGVNNV